MTAIPDPAPGQGADDLEARYAAALARGERAELRRTAAVKALAEGALTDPVDIADAAMWAHGPYATERDRCVAIVEELHRAGWRFIPEEER